MSEQNAGNVVLKSCPMCGGEAILENLVMEAVVRCKACGVRAVAEHGFDDEAGVEIAARKWNSRAPSVGAGEPAASGRDAVALARLFHETYERLAPDFGYETRDDTKAFDPETPNGRLMIAVCASVAAASGREEGLELGVGLVPLPANSLERYSMMFARDHGPFTNTALADMHIDLARALYGEAETEFPLSPSSAHPAQGLVERVSGILSRATMVGSAEVKDKFIKQAITALSAQDKDNGWFRIDDTENPAPKAESEVRLHNAAVFEACRHWPATNRGVSYREAFIQGAQWARERYADVGALREALERIAAFYDTHANERLMTTGSYSGFDEPNAVEIARTVLKKGLPSNGQKT